MNYYENEFSKLQDEFHETIEHFPLFKEMIDDIYDKNIKEIDSLLNKNDEYYLKEAIKKLKDLIDYIKEMSINIQKEYSLFDKQASEWEKKDLNGFDPKDLEILNQKINQANLLIRKHRLEDIKEANKIMHEVLQKIK